MSKFTRYMLEVAPPGEKAERFIKKNKEAFTARYGDKGKNVLYATAWKMFGKKESVDEARSAGYKMPKRSNETEGKFEVKWATNKKGPIYVSKGYKTHSDAKDWLAAQQKDDKRIRGIVVNTDFKIDRKRKTRKEEVEQVDEAVKKTSSGSEMIKKEKYQKLMKKYSNTPITKVPRKDWNQILTLGDELRAKRLIGDIGYLHRSRQEVDEASNKFPKWWEDDPRAVLTKVYHAKRQIPPKLDKKSWQKLVNALQDKRPAPLGEYRRWSKMDPAKIQTTKARTEEVDWKIQKPRYGSKSAEDRYVKKSGYADDIKKNKPKNVIAYVAKREAEKKRAKRVNEESAYLKGSFGGSIDQYIKHVEDGIKDYKKTKPEELSNKEWLENHIRSANAGRDIIQKQGSKFSRAQLARFDKAIKKLQQLSRMNPDSKVTIVPTIRGNRPKPRKGSIRHSQQLIRMQKEGYGGLSKVEYEKAKAKPQKTIKKSPPVTPTSTSRVIARALKRSKKPSQRLTSGFSEEGMIGRTKPSRELNVSRDEKPYLAGKSSLKAQKRAAHKAERAKAKKKLKQPVSEAKRKMGNVKDVPVYREIEGKKGHHEVIGHVHRSAKSVGAAKLGNAATARQTTKLKGPEFPEGPGWVVQDKLR